MTGTALQQLFPVAELSNRTETPGYCWDIGDLQAKSGWLNIDWEKIE